MYQRAHRGFTLIELAVVTAIIGLLVAGAVSSFGALRINSKIKETNRFMENAELLLQSFVARNGRLPCPADPLLDKSVAADAPTYAREHNATVAGAGCHGNRSIAGTGVMWGVLPARDLGVPARELTDGWNNQIYYVVVNNATLSNSLTTTFWALDDGNNEVELWDKADDDASLPARQQIVNQGVVALISAGPNASGAYTLDGARLPVPVATALAENDNQDADINFVRGDFSDEDDTPFDDVVRVLTEDDVVIPLAENGTVDTKADITQERMDRIVDGIFAFAAADDNDLDGNAIYAGPGANPDPTLCILQSDLGSAVPTNFSFVFPVINVTWAYPCTNNLRTVGRRIPQSDTNTDGVGDAVALGTIPFTDVGLTAAEVVDAWGSNFTYDPDDQAANPANLGTVGLYSNGAAGDAIVVTSLGPDRTAGTGDDITSTFSMRQALGWLLRAQIRVD